MKSKAIKFLEEHSDGQTSRLTERVKWRSENDSWLKLSRAVAISLIDFMDQKGWNRQQLAHSLGISNQYLGRLLSGTENLSLKSIGDLQEKLGIVILEPVFPLS